MSAERGCLKLPDSHTSIITDVICFGLDVGTKMVDYLSTPENRTQLTLGLIEGFAVTRALRGSRKWAVAAACLPIVLLWREMEKIDRYQGMSTNPSDVDLGIKLAFLSPVDKCFQFLRDNVCPEYISEGLTKFGRTFLIGECIDT